MNGLLKRLGLEVVYVCSWGTFPGRYTSDQWAVLITTRRNHTRYPYAPPWAKLVLRRLAKDKP